MLKTKIKKIQRFLPIIGIIILFYIIYTLDLSRIVDALLRISPIFILLGLLLTIPRLIVRNYAWQIIQKEQKIYLSFFKSLKIFLIGFFYGSITPGYFGQLMRVLYLKKETKQPYGKLFVCTFLEVIIHSLSMYGMIFIGAILVLGSDQRFFYIISIFILIQTVILLYFIKKERGEKIFQLLIKLFIPKKFKRYFYLFVNTFYHDFPSINKLIFPLILGLFSWIIIFSQEYMVVLSLGIDLPYIYFILLYPIANAIGFLPITFAGLGTREAMAIYLFSIAFFSVSKEEILIVSLLGFLITDIFTGFIGFLLSLSETKIVNYNVNILK